MSGPDLEPLDAHLQALLDAERARPAAPPELRDRVFSRVDATLGLGGPGGEGGGGGAGDGGAPSAGGASQSIAGGAAAGSPLGGLLQPILLGITLGCAVIAGAAARSAPAPASQIAAPASSATVEPAPKFESPKAVTIEQSAAEAPTTVAAAPPPPSAQAGRDADLAAERAILDDAQRALVGGRSAAAFEVLARHASEFPRGRLSEEREGLWIRALVGAGRIEEARDRAARFRRLFPRSMLLPALESTLGTIP